MNLGVIEPMPLGRPYRGRPTTLDAMVAMSIVMVLLDWLSIPTSGEPLPLWLRLVVGAGAVAVGAGVRRLEKREHCAGERVAGEAEARRN